MKSEKRRWPVFAGIALCILTLVLSVVLQEAGYLTYLDGDAASEVIMAKRQADTGSLIQMDWLHSTEVHILYAHAFYAMAFAFTDSFMWARIIGNTIAFVCGMLSCVYLCRKLGFSTAKGLWTAALLPITTSTLYATNITIGGYYIVHLSFAYLGAALWLQAASISGGKKKALISAALFLLLCCAEGLLSVRYVLCFVCPMVVVAALEMMLAPQLSRTLRDHHMRFGGVTAAGFVCCLAGFVASEVLFPRLFLSGAGSATSFVFNPLDGGAMFSALAVVFADFLKLLGWQGAVPLFSREGIVNLCIAAVLVLGGIMTVRVYRALDTKERMGRRHKRMMEYAFWAFMVNLFCFVFIKGTYLNRYLITAVLFFVPVLTIVVSREKNLRLRISFLACLVVMLGLGGMNLLMATRAQREGAQARHADMIDAADFLMEEGYTHGYGNFWTVRVVEELTEGRLTFAGVSFAETEEGAASPVAPDMIRWLEPDSVSHLDACSGKTFMLFTHEESEQISPWLKLAEAELIYENAGYKAYGMESSQALHSDAMFLRMKLENARYEDGVFHMDAHARMRVPTGYREAGNYVISFDCEGEPSQDSRIQIFTTRQFALTAEQAIVQGANEFRFELPEDDKYFMVLFTGGEAEELRIVTPEIRKEK